MRTIVLIASLLAAACHDAGPGGAARYSEAEFDELPRCEHAAAASDDASDEARRDAMDPAEPPCTVVLRETGVVLAGTRDGSQPDPTGYPAMDSRGRFIAPTYTPGQIALWDSAGRLVGTFGREGRGPGELQGRPWIWVDAWDTIHAVDPNRVWTVLAPKFTFVRRMEGTAVTPGPISTVLASGVAVSTQGPSGGLFTVVDAASGDPIRSFGRPGEGEAFPRRLLAPSSDSTFWAVPLHRYDLSEWTTGGRRSRGLERRPDWFPERQDDSGWDSGGGEMPPPVVNDLWYDAEEDLLWIRIMVPDPKTSRNGFAPGEIGPEEIGALYDVILEVVDPDSGRVLASHRSDGLEGTLSRFLGRGLAYRRGKDDVGLDRFTILELRAVQGGGR